jgi:subtilisin family serine protease
VHRVGGAAGNEGEQGMHFPGAYAPVISAGSVGWTGEWLFPDTQQPRYRMWWLQYEQPPMLPDSVDVTESNVINETYVSDFSSRALLPENQQLDVMAPGSWVRGPFPGDPGYRHLPWWAKGIGDLHGGPSNFFYVGGTSMATPHVASVAALMLEKNHNLRAADVENILNATAIPMPKEGSRAVFDFDHPAVISWDTDCDGVLCDPVGSGLVQADGAVNAVN